ncbi:MAG: glycoside hydrolase family 97 N-terminal domain-containing protein, partial [Gemmatimonadaceae bacterium]
MDNWIRFIRRSLIAGVASITMMGSIAHAQGAPGLRVTSPDGKNSVLVEIRDGSLVYSVQRQGRAIILPSRLGMEFSGAKPLRDSLIITGSTRKAVDETWTQPWGEVARVRDNHNELRVSVAERLAPSRRFDVTFRAFNDGIGFRYEFPEQANLRDFVIMEELTEFSMADNSRSWWIPSNRPRLDRSEMLYSSSPVSVMDSVQTPITMETIDGRTVIVLHEANLNDYARMNIKGPYMDN